MTLLDHALNIHGAFPPERQFNPMTIKPGWTCQRVEWAGCMAERREEGAIGTVLKVGVTSEHCGQSLGLLVEYDDGVRWEPFDYIRLVNGAVEIWR